MVATISGKSGQLPGLYLLWREKVGGDDESITLTPRFILRCPFREAQVTHFVVSYCFLRHVFLSVLVFYYAIYLYCFIFIHLVIIWLSSVRRRHFLEAHPLR